MTAREVLGNIDAMAYVDEVAKADRVDVRHLLEAHRRLLGGTPLDSHAGRTRTVQNWIGGSDFNPCAAAFVPPPPEMVDDLLEDLCAFCNDDALPPVAQAAIAHAQFETIHPFVDGNGRIGRALLYVVLRRRGVARRVFPPCSLVLATRARDYIGGLTATHYRGSPASREAHEGLNHWVAVFASAARRAAAEADAFENRIEALQAEWRVRLGRVRSGSAADLLLRAIAGAPVLTVRTGAELVGRSVQASNEAINRLVRAAILRPTNLRRHNRAFEAPEIIHAFTDLERALASPFGDTRVARPVPPVPPRRRPA